MITRAMTLGVLVCACVAAPVAAQIAVSSNDNKVVLEDGVQRVVQNPPPDTATIIDLSGRSPRIVSELQQVPGSVIGPPLSVAIAPDESIALVTANMKIDPADPTRTVPDNRMSVIDLRATPPRVIATLETGAGPAGLSINRQGTMALVANRNAGTVSVFMIRGNQVTPGPVVQLPGANAASAVSHVQFTPDGRHALVTRDGDHTINVLAIDGDRVTATDRTISAGLRPYGLAVHPSGRLAIVANIGRTTGDADTLSVIDLGHEPYRVVGTYTVGLTPEGITISPDGQYVAVVLQNGSNVPRSSPFHTDAGRLVVLRINGFALARVADAPVGHWPQGAAFARDSRTILVGNMVERTVQQFRLEGNRLREAGPPIRVGGGSAAIRTAERPR